MSELKDHRGKLVEKESLDDEIIEPSTDKAGVFSSSSFLSDSIADTLTPKKLGLLIQAANSGDVESYLTLAEEIEERDLHYHSVLGTRKMAISGLPVKIVSPVDKYNQKILDACQAIVDAPSFDLMLFDLLDGIAKGYSVVEIVWNMESNAWTPARFEWRDPRHFKFDTATMKRLLLCRDGYTEEELPAFKFITHIPKIKSGVPIRGGLARLAVAAYVCKSFTIKDWLTFIEIFGHPLRIGRFPNGATSAQKSSLRNALRQIGVDASAIIPEDMEIEIKDGTSSRSGDNLFLSSVDFWNKEISKGVLGQTMSSENGSSLAQAKVHNLVREDILKFDKAQLESTLKRDLIVPFIDLNFGKQEFYPSVQLLFKSETDLELIKTLPALIDRGMRVNASEVRDLVGLSDPEEGDEVLEPQAKPEAPTTEEAPQEKEKNTQALCPLCDGMELLAAQKEGTELDEIAEIHAEEYDRILGPLIGPILDELNASTSIKDFKKRLGKQIEAKTSIDNLVDDLAIAIFKGRSVGDVRDRPKKRGA